MEATNKKPALLFLVHRIPFPPNKGDKIRSFNVLKLLAKHFCVHLGAFVDDQDDFKHVDKLNAYCASTCLLSLNTRSAKLKSLSGILTARPLTLPYYFDRKMQHWVDEVIDRENIGKSLVFSSSMAQYLSGDRYCGLKRLIDFVDIDSDKWSQYIKSAPLQMKPVYIYEARMLLAWEKKITAEFDHSFFVSQSESDLFKQLSPHSADKVSHFNNGVDTEFFSPKHVFDSPYEDNQTPIVFTGAMDYWANADAVIWFSQRVLPALCQQNPQLKFYIVGSKPDSKVKALAELPNIVVTGAVDDIRPYLAHAVVSVAPMRIARGIQNKVLEAMAMEKIVVVSPQGYEGINASNGQELLLAEDENDWINVINDLLSGEMGASMGCAARKRVVNDYSWQGSLARLEQYL